VELALTPVTSRLGPPIFKRIFLDAYRRGSPAAKHHLSSSLEAFLARHPRSVGEYERVILELLRSNDRNLYIRGLGLVALLSDLSEPDLRRVERALGKDTYSRMSALLGLRRLLERIQHLSPRVAAFCLSAELRSRVEAIRTGDRDPENRRSARDFLRMRAVHSRAQTSRPRRRARRRVSHRH
jgi:hypothetical protein